MKIILEIFYVFLRLGCTSFGGPIAHLAYFHDEFVLRRGWISGQAFQDHVSLCQFLPGPTSSQVGMLIGFSRGRYIGALVAWLGFTLPSAAFLLIISYFAFNNSIYLSEPLFHGLKIAALAIVAQAILTTARQFCPDPARLLLALLACTFTLFISFNFLSILILFGSGLYGYFFLNKATDDGEVRVTPRASRKIGLISIVLFFSLLTISFFIAGNQSSSLQFAASFYRTGSLVFGGGHVVLPLLQAELVTRGLISQINFLNGYALAQAVPGPLFTISAYLGGTKSLPIGIISLFAIFIPSFLLIFGIMPFWIQLKNNQRLKNSLLGINAAVVGLLLAVFMNPVLPSTIFSWIDFLIACSAFLALWRFRWPTWLVLFVCAAVYQLQNVNLV